MNTLKESIFVSLEGGEGSGKTMLSKALYEHYKDEFHTIMTRDPGGTEFGMKVRSILLDPAYKERSKLSELYLYHAARADLVDKIIKPAREQKKLIFCDRFFDSTWVYQGNIRGHSDMILNNLDFWTCEDMHQLPDYTIICNVDAKVGLTRALGENDERIKRGGNDESLWESMGLKIHEKINKAFLNRAKNNDLYNVINVTDMSKEDVIKAGIKIVDSIIMSVQAEF